MQLTSHPARLADLDDLMGPGAWAMVMGLPKDRKSWEWAYIVEALHLHGNGHLPKRGLGFAVGKEPLPSFLAYMGCEIVATDQADPGNWAESDQHAATLDDLWRPRFITRRHFDERVSFRHVDMNHLPPTDDLGTFDFTWSSCAFEHLGSLQAGIEFVVDQMRFVKPGGIAVHTTEWNVSGGTRTLEAPGLCLYRTKDFQALAHELTGRGYRMELDFALGNDPFELAVAEPPAEHPHMRLRVGGYVTTSFGLVIENPPATPADR